MIHIYTWHNFIGYETCMRDTWLGESIRTISVHTIKQWHWSDYITRYIWFIPSFSFHFQTNLIQLDEFLSVHFCFFFCCFVQINFRDLAKWWIILDDVHVKLTIWRPVLKNMKKRERMREKKKMRDVSIVIFFFSTTNLWLKLYTKLICFASKFIAKVN